MATLEIARAYLDAVAARDYDRIRSLMADDLRLRDLSPSEFTQFDDADEALGYMREFLDTFDSVRLLESDVYDIGKVTYIRARAHAFRPFRGWRAAA